MCPKFELAINSLYSKGKYDIYVTGSNAFLLSADLATLFTGRYIEIHVFPFSFQEYCQYYDDVSDKDKLFDDYAIKGGLAGSYAYRTEKDRTNYIKEGGAGLLPSPRRRIGLRCHGTSGTGRSPSRWLSSPAAAAIVPTT